MTQPAIPIEQAGSPAPFDVERVRADFPALHQQVHGKPLVYLDNAATALKPQVVIDAVTSIYGRDCANIHRGVHVLSQRATQAYEGAREIVRRLRDFYATAPSTPGTAPVDFRMKRRSSASAWSFTATSPPMRSEWPLTYLVEEWTEKSAPSSRGRWL